MTALYAATAFLGSFLLYWIQPLAAKAILPRFGGAPAVWNSCIFFFEFVLLAGYFCVHAARRFDPRRQSLFYAGLALLSLLPLLYFQIEPGEPTRGFPALGVLAFLATSLGLPFLIVSANAVMLQKWFSGLSVRDPIFLYRAGNVANCLALVLYPVWIEHNARLCVQRITWIGLYALLAALLCACVLTLQGAVQRSPSPADEPSEPIPALRKLRWVALGFVPASMMLALTSHLGSEVAPVPLIWAVTLGLLFLSFALTFAERPVFPHSRIARLLPMLLPPLSLLAAAGSTQPLWLVLAVYLIAFFVVALAFNGELARTRPRKPDLTVFYLWMAMGGSLGGLFNALAPALFTSILEFPLTLVLAAFLSPGLGREERRLRADRADFLYPALALCATIALALYARGTGAAADRFNLKLVLVLPAVLAYVFSERPARFALALASLFLAGRWVSEEAGKLVYARRSFFGVHRVTLDPLGGRHWLSHGNTVHGGQNLDPGGASVPLAYYHPRGPLGQVFAQARERSAPLRVAVVGLGTGSILAYARPGDGWTFYEIDPAVHDIASDSRFFTYLKSSPVPYAVVYGDARVSLSRSGRQYDVIVLDAFGSDFVPVHLLTREAVDLYFRRLGPGGVLAFHISSRYMDLARVIADLGAELRLHGIVRADPSSPKDLHEGKFSSIWALLARKAEDLGKLADDASWKDLEPRPGGRVWTDEYSDPLRIFSFRGLRI